MDQITPKEIADALTRDGQDVHLSDAGLQLLRDAPRSLKVRLAKCRGQNIVYFGPTPINFVELNREEAIKLGELIIQLAKSTERLVLTKADAPFVP